MDMFLLIKVVFWSYVALLVGAALFDVWKFIIPNWIPLALIGLFLFAVAALPLPIDWVGQLGGLAVMLAGSLLLYSFGHMGGGDLKLAAAVGLWVGFSSLPQFVLVVALAGGAFALALIVLRRLLTGLLVAQGGDRAVTLPRVLLPGEKIPYGVAIATGGIWIARDLPHLGMYL